jgi:Ca-activated chloride channel family protein
VPAGREQIVQGMKWIDALEATGGTAINDALLSALDLRPGKDDGRTFTVVFFTDGQPTIGETNPGKILDTVGTRNTASTRIFTFGVGDDVNATMLDQLAERTRAVSTYVRPSEDIEAKVSGLYSKISHPVLTNLKLSPTAEVSFSEIYPAQLPDLFHGQQLVVLGRYSGKGPAAVRLTGSVGKETRELVYELTFPEKTGDERAFVEHIWARRKVGYLLDQIRANGEKKELVEEVTALAKRYGITTPYTSYLIVPDGPMPVVNTAPRPRPDRPDVSLTPGGGAAPGAVGAGFGGGGFGGFGGGVGGFNGGSAGVPAMGLLVPPGPGGTGTPSQQSVTYYAQMINGAPGGQMAGRGAFETKKYGYLPADPSKTDGTAKPLADARDKWNAYEQARKALALRQQSEVQAGKLGVDLSVHMNNLRNQSQMEFTALRQVNGRNCMEVGGVWIDEGFTPKTTTLVVKAQSPAYFRILELQPKMKEVLQLGNYLVWMTPSGTALVIDTIEGKDKLPDEEINKLFVARK